MYVAGSMCDDIVMLLVQWFPVLEAYMSSTY